MMAAIQRMKPVDHGMTMTALNALRIQQVERQIRNNSNVITTSVGKPYVVHPN